MLATAMYVTADPDRSGYREKVADISSLVRMLNLGTRAIVAEQPVKNP
jgi:hypothetical protein